MALVLKHTVLLNDTPYYVELKANLNIHLETYEKFWKKVSYEVM